MKKILCLALTLMFVLSAFSAITVNAAGTSDLDSALKLHWDFEGDTLEEQLSNKAVADDVKNSLELGTAGNNASKIENGVAMIGSAESEYLDFSMDPITGKGQDFLSTVTTEYTLYLKFKVTGTANNPHSAFFVVGPDGTADTDHYTLRSRFFMDRGGVGAFRYDTNLSGEDKTFPTDMRVVDDHYVHVAVVIEKDAEGYYKGTCYLSTDDWNYKYMKFTDRTDIPIREKPLHALSRFYFGGGSDVDAYLDELNPGFRDKGKTYYYDDIRIYNRALTQDEVTTINFVKADDAVIDNEFLLPDDYVAPPQGETTATKVDTTAAAETEAESSGCGSMVMGMVFVPMAAAVGCATLARKKRRK